MTLGEAFAERVTPAASGECWPWEGSRFSTGYGRLGYGGRTYRAHRLSYALNIGPIPEGLDVLHRCDNPPCVNPAHLFIGSQADNAADASQKGRLATGDRNGARRHPERLVRGERHHSARLTEEDVREIRRRAGSGERQVDLAAEFGIGQPRISKVVLRQTWKAVR